MTETKTRGRIYTPDYIVNTMLDFCGYSGQDILGKHVIDNSCGDGAFLVEIISRYCAAFLVRSDNKKQLSIELETYIHGIEIDGDEHLKCLANANDAAAEFGIKDVEWDIICGDTLAVDKYNGRMDFVVGNPPYVRVHNLENYDMVKGHRFAAAGMTDLFIVFFEIGLKMLREGGRMCLITPSSWLGSKAGETLRRYVSLNRNLSALIDLGHFQPFKATTYTLISLFRKGEVFDRVAYFKYDGAARQEVFVDNIAYGDLEIGGRFYISDTRSLHQLNEIRTTPVPRRVVVKNGFATLADKVFIGVENLDGLVIDVIKASTGKWTKAVYPYDDKGKPLCPKTLMGFPKTYEYLLSHKEELPNGKKAENDETWFLYGRTQALLDVSKEKISVNTTVSTVNSIKLNEVGKGKGLYSGLYILTSESFETIRGILLSENFIEYVASLKGYKSGGYYTFSSKDLEQYINYKLHTDYDRQPISGGDLTLF